MSSTGGSAFAQGHNDLLEGRLYRIWLAALAWIERGFGFFLLNVWLRFDAFRAVTFRTTPALLELRGGIACGGGRCGLASSSANDCGDKTVAHGMGTSAATDELGPERCAPSGAA